MFGCLANFDGAGTVEPPVAGYSKGTMLIRRAAFDRVGAFGDWRLGEFVDWYARAVDAGLETLMLPDVLLLRRVHDANRRACSCATSARSSADAQGRAGSEAAR